jgi:sodium-coupled neutral amino acid transporter 10
LFVLVISLSLGILLPAIEVVLSLMGSTIGLIICLIFPATIFIKNTSKNTNERAAAQVSDIHVECE